MRAYYLGRMRSDAETKVGFCLKKLTERTADSGRKAPAAVYVRRRESAVKNSFPYG